MTDTSSLAERQFSPRANAYVESQVHARGEDLDALKRFVEMQHFHSALDLGCGGGHVSFCVAPFVTSITAYDLSSAMLTAVSTAAEARGIKNLSTQQGQAETLPFADASFDFIATRYSAHHWLDLPKALREVRRVLKPSGAFMVMDCIAPDNVLCDTFIQTIEMLRDPSHVRDYSVAEWNTMLTEAGFHTDEPVTRRIHLDYQSWIARMQTPPVLAHAISALMEKADDAVRRYFAIAPDGSFMLDTASILCRPA